MPDLRQALKDFVATSNSGKYATEDELMSKFPELKGYDIQALKDFVATSNSGKYATEDELFSKFPEFNQGPKVKKKFALDSSSAVGSSVSQKSPEELKQGFQQAITKKASVPTDMSGKPIFNPKGEEAIKPVMQKIASKSGSDKRISGSLAKISKGLMNQTEEDVVSELSKDQTLKDLGFTFEESGWTGDYMKVIAPDKKTTIEISLDNFLNSKSAKQSLALQNFIKNNTTEENLAELEKIVSFEDAEEQKYEDKKRKYEDIFDRQLGIKSKPSESKYLKDRLSVIDESLINNTEENVVAEMDYQFSDLGFKFEESGLLGDYMKVTSPDGKKKIEISLDNLFSSKSKTQSEILKKFIQDNTPAKRLFVLENTIKDQDVKFNSEKQVDEAIKVLNKDVTLLNAKQKQFIIKKNQYEKDLANLGPNPSKESLDSLEQRRIALSEEMNSLIEEDDKVKFKGRKLDSAVGKYTINKSKQGDWVGGLRDAFFGGVGKISSGISSLITDITGEAAPMSFLMSGEDATKYAIEAAKKMGLDVPKDKSQASINKFKQSLTEDQLDEIESYVRDKAKKNVKKEILPLMRVGAKEILGDPETTQQWENLKKEGFWGAAILGTAESLPAMIGGSNVAGWAQRTAQMYAQISDGLAEEMENDPDFANISENEKLAITVPIGITSAILEAYGLRNVLASKGVITNLTMRALGKAGKGVTAKTFRELVENEVETAIARGALTITAAGVAEFETGAAQELTETGFKALYNDIKGKVDPVTGEEVKMFDTPDSIYDLIENVAVAGAQEAVGGFVLGVPSGISAAYSKKGFLKMNDVTFETFANMANDDKMQSAYIASLKDKITQGIITEKEAKESLNNYRNSVGLFRQLPEGLTTQEKKEAMNLLKEKRDLENYVEGKDPALVTKQKNRITEIDNELTKLSETDAVQEQSTTEVPVQSETITSETLETGVSKPGPEVVTEQVTEEEVVQPEATPEQVVEEEVKPVSEKINVLGQEVDMYTNYLPSKENVDENSIYVFRADSKDGLPEVIRDKATVNTSEINGIKSETWSTSIDGKDLNELYSKSKPEQTTQEETIVEPVETQPEVTAPQTIIEEPSITIAEAINDRTGEYVYDGKKGAITTIGQTVVLETDNEIIDLGNVDELSDSTLEDFGIIRAEDVILNDDNSISIGDKNYLNNYSNPEAAISQDKDGNYSVTLDTENGQKRTFRGQQAEQIVYQMKLKNFEQNGTDEQIEQANELADEAIRIEEETGQPSVEREGKTVRKGKRKQRTLKQPKEPLTKAEREAEPKIVSEQTEVAPVETQAVSEQEVNEFGIPPAPEGFDIVSETKSEAAPTKVSSEVAAILKRLAEAENKRYAEQKAYFNARQNNKTGLKEFRQWNKTKEEVKKIEAELKEAKDKATPAETKAEVAPIVEAETAPVEEIKVDSSKPSLEEIMENSRKEADAIQSEVDEFNSVNNRVYKGRTKKELESDLYEAKEKLYNAQKNISRSEDADEAIAEYNKAKKNVAKVESQIQELNDFNKVSGFVFEQIDSSKKSDYEFRDLFNKDPRIAAIQDAKEMIEWFNSQEGREEDVAKYNNDVKLLEQDIKNYPVKSKPKAEAAPVKKESKIDKEIAQLEGDVEYYESKIQEIEEEIAIENGNTKEGLVELKEKVKKELEEVKKDKSLSRDEKIDKVEEIKYQIENFKEEQESIIESYKDDLKEAKSEYKKALNKVNKLYEKKRNATDVNELLNLDTKNKDGLNRVLDFLNDVDDSLTLDPNELNDVTRVMTVNTAKAIVKTLKALVNAGITLKEAIDSVSDIYNITSSKIIDALDIASKINENKSEGISEMEAPGYNQLSKEIDNMISNDSTIDEVLDSVKESDVYKNATDVQRDLLVRDVRKRFGLREKSAPSVGKLFGTIKDVKNITMREKDLLTKQIKDRAKGARESVQAWKEQSKQFADELKELIKSGKITNKQVGIILKKFSNVNIFSEKSMNRFTDYMTKVFNDSNYNEKLSNARKTLSSLKKLSKNQDKNGDLRALASEFIKIDPSFVENIDEYNDIANKLKIAIQGSTIRKANVKFADTVNAEDVISYVEKILVDQESKIREEKIQEIQDLLGVDASKFDAKEIDAMLESEDDNRPNDNEKIVRATIKKAFDIYSSVIKEMLSTGADPFTDEEVTFDDKQRDIIERFMAIDPNKIENAKDALRAVDSLINFVQNKSTAGMLKTIAQYEGVEGGEQAVSEGLKAKRLRKYFSSGLGLVLGQQTTSLPVLFDKMFKGVTRALRVEELIGLSDLINNSSKAESETNRIVKNYVKQFYKTKANKESFNSAYNDLERGIFAHVFRNVIGNEETMKKVFDKRKQEVLDTIELLSNSGNDSEVETAKLLQKVYDKILDGAENIQDVRSKVDATNAKAVEYWIKEWSNKYGEMSDLALNFYNKVLGKDLNFTPDRIKKLQDKVDDVDLDDAQSQFFANTDDILYDKKSGSLMDKQENRSIPKDMYVDFSFDKKNSNAMNDALTDLYTAFDVAKVGAFLKSKEFKKIFPSSQEANLIDKRIKKFVRLTRKKTPFSNEDISNFLRKADKIAKLGITASLASPGQPFKQTIPVMFSTAMSAGSLGFGIAFNTNFNNWLNDLGFAISNRGVESQAQIDSFNKLIDKAADMPLDKAIKFIEKTNDKALKALLVNFDVWIARASFKAYYEQSLKRQGLKSSFIDYSKHKTNKEAANYAQRMVDRQQNISNPALAGDLFTSNSQTKKTFVKMLMPFSSFRMNQSARLGADLSTLEYWNTSTKEDKVIALRSLLGYTLEAAAYRSLQIGFSLLTYTAAKAIMGADDEEEDKKTTDNLIKGAAQSAFVDTFSPIPMVDPFMQDAISYSVEEIESLMDVPEEERTKLFGSQEQSALKVLGTYGIPLQKAKDIYSLGRLAYTGKYKDNYGKEQNITEDQADQLKTLIGPLFAASVIGVASPDMTQIVNKSIKAAKKNSAPIDKAALKQRNPEKYEELFGEGSRNYEIEQRQKERDKEIEDRIKERMNR